MIDDIKKSYELAKKDGILGSPNKDCTITESEVIELWRECYGRGITIETYKNALSPANFHKANDVVIRIERVPSDTINDMCKSLATEHGIEVVPMKMEDSRIIIKRKEDNTDDLRIIDNNDWIED